jgi:lipopolysaccharide transport system ATP-binding protein
MSVVIQADRLSKQYRLGTINAKRLKDDVQRWYARLRRQPDPLVKIGQEQKDPTDGGANRNGSIDNTIWALNDVSFEVKQGEVVGIIGRNGAGKSTLLKILSQVTAPSSGEVRIKGRIASLLEVGTGFHPELSGRDNIFLNGAILGMTKAEIRRKFDEIVAFSEVEKFIDTPVKRYSSGMYVRLAFAVAAHLEPEILIVDEVLAVGDADFQKKCLGKMQEVSGEGRTVLFVSHNMAAIQSLCQRVTLLRQGRIAYDGLPGDVLQAYLGGGASSSPVVSDLRNRARRRNSTERALVKAWVETADGQVTQHVMMGDPVYFCFEFKCQSAVVAPICGFGIEDSLGRRVFSLNSLMNGKPEYSPKPLEQGVAKMYLPRNPLLPGSYYVTVSLNDQLRSWIDFVEQAVNFNVESNDVYGSGAIPQPSHGVVFVDGEIQVNRSMPNWRD